MSPRTKVCDDDSERLEQEISDLFAGLRAEMGADDAESPWDEMVGRFQQPGMGGHVPTCDIDKVWGY